MEITNQEWPAHVYPELAEKPLPAKDLSYGRTELCRQKTLGIHLNTESTELLIPGTMIALIFKKSRLVLERKR